MTSIKCNNCGSTIMGGDDYCPNCGARVHRGNVAAPHGTGAMPPRYNPSPSKSSSSSGNNSNGPWIIGLALVVAIAIVGGAWYLGVSHQDEVSMWEQCESSRDIATLKDYMDRYPSGEHYEQARHMYTMLINEKTAWEQVQAGNNESQLRAFINSHPASKYLPQARELLDDVMWNNVIEKNTKQAYIDYISDFPSGHHSSQARSRIDDFRRAELTVDERNQVVNTIGTFLSGLEQWNPGIMTMTCNTSMTSFMGKRNATLIDVREYYDAYRESDIDSISFNSLAVNVTKKLSDNEPQYSAQFTVTRNFKRQNTAGGTVALMRGNAVLDRYFRFTELNLDKERDM